MFGSSSFSNLFSIGIDFMSPINPSDMVAASRSSWKSEVFIISVSFSIAFLAFTIPTAWIAAKRDSRDSSCKPSISF